MIKKIALIPILLTSLGLFGQAKTFEKLTINKKMPTVIFNNDIIGGFDFMKEIDQNKIKSVTVIKPNSDKAKVISEQFSNLGEHGFLSIVVDETLNTKTIREVLKFMDLDATTPVYLNGYKITSLDMKILPKSILKIEKLNHEPSNYDLKELINISTTNANQSGIISNSKIEKIEPVKTYIK